MTIGLSISMILYLLMGIVSLFLVWEFWKSKNGMLRKLLIFYFFAQFWVVFISGGYFYLDSKDIRPLSFDSARIIALSPITISMMAIWFYLIWQRTKKVGR